MSGTGDQRGQVPPPSGAAPVLYDVIRVEGYEAPVWHFRFRWPGLVPEMLAGAAMEAEMEALCAAVAVPLIMAEGGQAERIVIAVADREIPFGAPVPEAVQSFEAFVLGADGGCEWEPF